MRMTGREPLILLSVHTKSKVRPSSDGKDSPVTYRGGDYA